ncbi:MAG: (4Fe-4S)-binding protein [Bacteroidales bacterium]|jgi:uncharacterized Fe-S cluster protein YjdI|nr:(4Fe-4S)-binding protein [Bacteroidales bacterium]
MERDKSLTDERKYTNGEISVYWKPSACVHASYCYRELIEVFDPSRRPWVDMKGSTTDRIIEVVNLCPTEALAWKWNDEEKNREVGSDQSNHIKFRRPELMEDDRLTVKEKLVTVKVMPNGPLVISGTFTLVQGGAGKEIKDGMISICRCGASDKKPYCDGRHRKIGFSG